MNDQLRAAELFASVSPAESFRSLSMSIAQADYWSFRSAADAAVAYQTEVNRLYAEYLFDHPNEGSGSTGTGFVPPHFEHPSASLAGEISSGRGLRDLSSLLGFNLAAFVGAYVAFLRYDVR